MSEARLAMSEGDAGEVRRVDGLAEAGAAGVADLLERLNHPSWAVRRAVVSALARVGAPAVEPLCAILRQHRDDEAGIAAAVDALSACRADVNPAVLALTSYEQPAPVICDAAQILGRRKSLAAVGTLERLIHHADDNVSVAAIEALGRIGSGAGIDQLLELAASRNFFRTFAALDVIGRSGDGRALLALLPLLDAPLLALEAVRALGHTGDAGAVTPLLDHLVRAPAGHVREIAVAMARIHRFQQERFGAARLVEDPIAVSARGDLVARLLLDSLDGSDEDEQQAIALLVGWRGGAPSVEALLDLLAGAPSVARVAAASLRRLGRAIDAPLLQRLSRGDSAERLRLLPLVGARSIERPAAPGRAASGGDASGEVVACLADPDPAVRVAACEALGRTGDTSAVAALFGQLCDRDRRVEHAASAAIQCLGSSETEALALAAGRSENADLRRTAIRIIAYFGYPSGLELLLEAAESDLEPLREAAVAGLAYLEDPRAVEGVLSAARHPAPRTRAAAARALRNLDQDAATTACLRAALGDGDPWVRYYACQSVGKLRDERFADAIVALVADPAGQVRVAVIDALSQLDCPVAVDALERAAGAADPDVRRSALIGLGVARRPASLPTVLEALDSGDAATRLVALSSTAQYDAPEVVPALRRGALDGDQGVSAAAVGFLGQREGAPATEALIDLLETPALREAVVTALARPTDGRVGAVLAALETRAEQISPWLVAALARMGRADADAALGAALKAPSAAARRAAAAALAERRSPDARAALEAAANADLDAEVRRIAVFALAAQTG